MMQILVILGIMSLQLLAMESQEVNTEIKLVTCLQTTIKRTGLTQEFEDFLGERDIISRDAIARKLTFHGLSFSKEGMLSLLDQFAANNAQITNLNLGGDFCVELASFGAPTIPLVVSNDGLSPS